MVVIIIQQDQTPMSLVKVWDLSVADSHQWTITLK